MFVGLGKKENQPIFKTKLFVYQFQANLEVNIVFVQITYLVKPETKIAGKGFEWEREFQVQLWSITYLLLT